MGQLWTAKGDFKMARDWFDKAIEERDPLIGYMAHSVFFDPLCHHIQPLQLFLHVVLRLYLKTGRHHQIL